MCFIWMGERNLGFMLRRWADNPGKKTWKRVGSQVRLIRIDSYKKAKLYVRGLMKGSEEGQTPLFKMLLSFEQLSLQNGRKKSYPVC